MTYLSGMTKRQCLSFLRGYLGYEASDQDLKILRQAETIACFLAAFRWFDYSETEQILQLFHDYHHTKHL